MKKKYKKKTKKFLIRKVVFVLILMMIFFAGRKGIYNYFAKQKAKKTRLLLNNNFVDLTDEIHKEDEVIYISKEDIKHIFDDTIYYNRGDEELITTYNKHVAVMHLERNGMMVNDSISEMKGMLKEIDSEIYLPVSDLGIVYDIEVFYAPATNIIIMDSTTKAKKQAIMVSDAKIKTSKNPFSIVVEKVKKGEYVTIIEENGSHLKVRTEQRKYGLC